MAGGGEAFVETVASCVAGGVDVVSAARGAARPDALLSQLYRSEAEGLRRYLTRLLKTPADAEDVAQEAFLRLHRCGDLSAYDHPRAVLFKTAYRLALNRVRSRRSGVIDRALPIPREAALPPAPTPSAEEDLISRERDRAYASALASLPPRCREVIELRTLQELSYKQMSDSLGISVSTLEKHLVRGKRICAEALAGWTSGAGQALAA